MNYKSEYYYESESEFDFMSIYFNGFPGLECKDCKEDDYSYKCIVCRVASCMRMTCRKNNACLNNKHPICEKCYPSLSECKICREKICERCGYTAIGCLSCGEAYTLCDYSCVRKNNIKYCVNCNRYICDKCPGEIGKTNCSGMPVCDECVEKDTHNCASCGKENYVCNAWCRAVHEKKCGMCEKHICVEEKKCTAYLSDGTLVCTSCEKNWKEDVKKILINYASGDMAGIILGYMN